MTFKSKQQSKACFATGGFNGKVDCKEWGKKTNYKRLPKKKQKTESNMADYTFPTFLEWLEAFDEAKWIQKAVDPEHKGFCTPMTKKTCTPRRKALAQKFKSGDIQKANLKKGDNPKGKG